MGKISEPCSEDAGLWRRMLTRAQQGNLTNHSFFHIHVVEGCLQSSMFCILGLPPVFTHHYSKRLKERITLEGADGRQWITMLAIQLDSQQYCFNLGWKEFAEDHDLAVNDQIVFLLFEDSHFLVQVFDSNNNFKGRVKGKEKAAASLAEKTKDFPVPRGNPLLYCDPETPKEVVIEIPDSSSEEDAKVPLKAPSGIKMRPKQTVSRSCHIRAARVDQDCEQTPQKHENQNVSSRSPPSSISAPSSPEPAPVLKRSRKLRGYDEDEDYVDPKADASAPKPAESETPSKRPRRDAAVSKANKLAEMMAAEATKKASSATKKASSATKKASSVMKKASSVTKKASSSEAAKKGKKESPPKGMKKTAEKKKPVVARPKMKVQKKHAKPAPAPPPPPEEPPKAAFKRPAKIARLGPPKVHNVIYVSKRRPVTDQERKETLEKAQERFQTCKNRHYVMQLRVSQVYCGYHLGVLPEFVEALQLPVRKETTTFYDVTGKTWQVDWQGDHPMKPGFNSRGWTKFVLDHCLEEGDVCVFELPDPKEFNISVTIFPVVPLGVIPELGWKAHYGGDHEKTFAVPRSPAENQHKFAVPRSPAESQQRSPLNNTPTGSSAAPPPVEIQDGSVAAHAPAENPREAAAAQSQS